MAIVQTAKVERAPARPGRWRSVRHRSLTSSVPARPIRWHVLGSADVGPAPASSQETRGADPVESADERPLPHRTAPRAHFRTIGATVPLNWAFFVLRGLIAGKVLKASARCHHRAQAAERDSGQVTGSLRGASAPPVNRRRTASAHGTTEARNADPGALSVSIARGRLTRRAAPIRISAWGSVRSGEP
jgi:hypothetical protein